MPTVDIISTLPDEILCHILSFLPTQNAIATTFLSKRWSSLWLSVPTLHFDDETYLINDNPYSSFDKFVRRAILARDLIKGFHLKCCVFSEYDLSDSDVNDWVDAAMQRGVEILDINLPYDPQRMMSLRFRVFSCRTLVVLKLIGWIYVDTFPAVVDFPSLKTLLLDVVDFIEPQCFMEFLGGCPNLEVLEAKNIFYLFRTNSSYGKGEFSLAKLVRGNIYNFQISFPLKAICNAEFLRVDKGAGVVPVFPNLTHLELVSDGDIDWRFVLAMLKKCPQLQILVLDKLKCLKASTDVVCSYTTLVPQCLSLHLKKCAITNYEGTESELHFAKYIMENSMSLQAMTINSLPSLSPEEKLEMKKELTLCSRRSATCKLSFK